LTYAQGGAQKLAWGSPLAGNGAPEVGRISPKDPDGLPAAPLRLDAVSGEPILLIFDGT